MEMGIKANMQKIRFFIIIVFVRKGGRSSQSSLPIVKILTLINNIFIVYPDIILSGFLFFFECKEIVEKYSKYLLELFLYTYRHFRDKFYDPLLEHLLNRIMFNIYF